ncbi:MAG: hypothetical protein OEM39_00920 [Acidimicrobiia bacterium]|nr:hypothetical protein [Acidimicrobiia bacterium]
MAYHDILLVLHISGAGIWLGANFMQALVPGLIGPTNPAAASWFRVTEKLSGRLYIPVGVTVLVTGVLLVLNSDLYGFGSVFVSIGFAAVVIGAVLGSTVFGPKSVAIADAIDGGDLALAHRVRATTGQFGVVDTLILVFTIYAMVSKLGA